MIPCRPHSSDKLHAELKLSTESVTWTDSANHELPKSGHFEVDSEDNLVLSDAEASDAGVYVCTMRTLTSTTNEVNIVRHAIRVNGNVVSRLA